MDHEDHRHTGSHADRPKPLFTFTRKIFVLNCERVFKRRARRFEGDAVAAKVAHRLLFIPLEKDQSTLYWLNTQVSFDPPPCDEFTTSDPRFSATRVSPPGTIVTLSPYST